MLSTEKWKPYEEAGKWASISYSGYACINLNACAQSNRKQDFLILVFDFVRQSVVRSVFADRKRAGSGDEIAGRQELMVHA